MTDNRERKGCFFLGRKICLGERKHFPEGSQHICPHVTDQKHITCSGLKRPSLPSWTDQDLPFGARTRASFPGSRRPRRGGWNQKKMGSVRKIGNWVGRGCWKDIQLHCYDFVKQYLIRSFVSHAHHDRVTLTKVSHGYLSEWAVLRFFFKYITTLFLL